MAIVAHDLRGEEDDAQEDGQQDAVDGAREDEDARRLHAGGQRRPGQ